jgi:hypothetical protein
MKAQEFRIGNLVYGKKIETVRGIIDGYVWFNDEANLHIELCQPIPLTKEWLLKFGFEKQIDDYYYFYCYYASFDADLPMWFGQEGCCQKETIKENIKYVHQLQNLWFGLTGEELTITE